MHTIVLLSYRDQGAEAMTPNAPLARVSPFPVLEGADQVGGLKGLQFVHRFRGSERRVDVEDRGRLDVPAKIVVGKNHLFDAIEPSAGFLGVDKIRRHASTW